jgi:hypothetical protein
MQLDGNAELGLTTAEDDPYLMMNHEKRAKMRIAIKRLETHCRTHPESPVALERPRLSVRNGLWIVLLGPSISEGIAGFGHTMDAALHAFDAEYVRALRSSGNVKFQSAISHEIEGETSESQNNHRGLTNSTGTQL